MKDMLNYLISALRFLAHNVVVYVVNKLKSKHAGKFILKEANYAQRKQTTSNREQHESQNDESL